MMVFCILLFSIRFLFCGLLLYGSRKKMNLHIAFQKDICNFYIELMIVVLIAIHQKENQTSLPLFPFWFRLTQKSTVLYWFV